MKIKTYKISAPTISTMTTEIFFSIASSKSVNDDLIKFVFDEKALSKMPAALRILKQMKRKGKIQLLTHTSEFKEASTTEVEYLLNKYPDIVNHIEEQGIIVKM